MIQAITLDSKLVYNNDVVGYRCKLIDGKLIDVEAGVVHEAGVDIPDDLPTTSLIEYNGLLISQYEVENNRLVYDGTDNRAIVKWLKKVYGVVA